MKIPNFKKLLSKFSLKKRGPFKSISEKANHDWKIILVCFSCLALVLLAGSLYMFIGVSKGDIFLVQQKQESAPATIDQSNLNNTIKFFEDRKTHLSELKLKPSQIGDPSL